MKCPHRGTVQPWSNAPVSFWKSQWPLPWGIATACLLAVFLPTPSPLCPQAAACVAIIPPVRASARVNKVKKALQGWKGEPLVYYNQSNFQELLRSPAAPLLAQYVKRD